MRNKRSFFVIFLIFSILVIGYFLIKPAFKYLSGYLSKSEQVKANVLIVEGWLPDYALDLACKEYREKGYQYIITTGIKYFEEYFNVSENGYLIFYPPKSSLSRGEISEHLIEVDAHGSLSGDYSAHFNLYVNDTLISSYIADRHKRKYSAKWYGSLSTIDSVMVQFTNDRKDENGDINLYVKDIVIDKKITIPYLYNSEYDMSKLDRKRRIVNNFNSTAELARNWLLSKGIDSSQIIAVPAERVRINRTLTSALAFRDWIKRTNIDIKGINIISLGTHARRTWMIFNKVLNEKYSIGIISIPDFYFNHSWIYKLFKTLRESLGIIYYWIILIPY